MRIVIDIICATIDDCNVINDMLISLDSSLTNLNFIVARVILVSQNKNLCQHELYSPRCFHLKLIKSDVLGLSVNRNKGLSIAKASYIMTIDADCKFDNEFFRNLRPYFDSDHSACFVSVKDPHTGCDALRKWPVSMKKIGMIERWIYSTSVNIIWRNTGQLYDEKFGIGAAYGSCEDVDFALRIPGNIIFNHKSIVYHPKQDLSGFPMAKIKNYSIGFGALCRKHSCNYGILVLIWSILAKLRGVLFGNLSPSVFFRIVLFRLRGFIEYT